jgi:hypothetical protein
MLGTNDCKVAPIQRRDRTDAESLGDRHDGRIHCPERKVVISAYELRDAHPIAREHGLGDQVPGGEITEEPNLGGPAQARFDEIGDFGDDELRHQQRTGMGFQKAQTLFVVAVVFIDVGVERPGVDDQRDLRASSRMISSMRRAVSREPLRPAFAAINFRRAPPPR